MTIRRSLTLAALLALPLAAKAAKPAEAPAAAEPQKTEQQASNDKKAAGKNCLTQTGSRLKSKMCEHGQVITRDELDRTGGADLGESLRRSSPSIRVGH